MTIDMPLLSIIVPIYKVEKYLDECVQSILDQTFCDFELILVDDGSPDGCPAMCDAYEEQDSRVRVIHKVNGGLSDARNHGTSAAIGDYILFIDSDDSYKNSDGFAALANRINKYHEDIIQIASEDVFQNTGARKLARGDYNINIINIGDKQTTINYFLGNGMFAASAWLMCVKRSLLLNHKIYFPIGVTAEDYVWLLKIQYYATSYGAVNELVYEYKKGLAGSITSKPRVSGILGMHKAIEFWLSQSDIPQGLNEFIAFVYCIMLITYQGLSINDKMTVKHIVNKDSAALIRSNSMKMNLIYFLIKLIGTNRVASLLTQIRKIR